MAFFGKKSAGFSPKKAKKIVKKSKKVAVKLAFFTVVWYNQIAVLSLWLFCYPKITFFVYKKAK